MSSTNKNSRKKRTQYVDEMEKNFHQHFEAGMKISEIANKYNVDVSYTYRLLEEIGKNNNVPREYYLERDSSTHISSGTGNASFTHYTPEQYESISKSFDIAFSDIKNLRQNIEALSKDNDEKEKDYE